MSVENQNEASGQKPDSAAASSREGYITKQEVARRLKKTVRTVENFEGVNP